MSRVPLLADVLNAVVPGRTLPVRLDDAQKAALGRDPDGRLALDVVRHLLGARAAAGVSKGGRFPLTEAVFQKIARRLGGEVGIKRSRWLLGRLRQAGVLEESGSYRQEYRDSEEPSGYRVRLYRLGVNFAPLSKKSPVGRRRPVKCRFRRRWWQHGLFGNPDGRPPPGYSQRALNQMRSREELDTWTGDPHGRGVPRTGWFVSREPIRAGRQAPMPSRGDSAEGEPELAAELAAAAHIGRCEHEDIDVGGCDLGAEVAAHCSAGEDGLPAGREGRSWRAADVVVVSGVLRADCSESLESVVELRGGTTHVGERDGDDRVMGVWRERSVPQLSDGIGDGENLRVGLRVRRIDRELPLARG
jgi:hypothetical protein